MKFNRLDNNFKNYYEYFYKNKSAFVLKPEKLRIREIPLGIVKDQDPSVNPCRELSGPPQNNVFYKVEKANDSEMRKRLGCDKK